MPRKKLNILHIAPYFPKECGIASYTKDLVTAYNETKLSADQNDVIALSDSSEEYLYPLEVKATLRSKEQSAYRELAVKINNSDYDLVHIQHEYGLYGGDDGVYILDLTTNLKKPYIITLHTVLSNPSANIIKITKTLAKNARAVIVMADEAIRRLESVYGLDLNNIHKIAHGVPDIPFDEEELFKLKFGYQGKKVISTFGLINQNKGIEYVIDALPGLVKIFPEIRYLVIGRTHPNIVKKEGEKYRSFLEERVLANKVSDHVVFINRFLSQADLIDYLRATDLYITPYLEPQQISSGALAYALGAGKACISTPYAYACEVLASNRGLIVPFRNSDEIRRTAEELFSNKQLHDEISKKSYTYGRKMIWPNIAKEHYLLFHRLFI